LAAANDRMKELAAERPGAYFVFCLYSHRVLATIDTSVQSDSKDGRFERKSRFSRFNWS
jgi:hypothetical protein